MYDKDKNNQFIIPAFPLKSKVKVSVFTLSVLPISDELCYTTLKNVRSLHTHEQKENPAVLCRFYPV